MKILIIPGSIRANSTSHKLIPEITKYFTEEYGFQISEAPGRLPQFNDAGEPGAEVIAWRKSITEADGIFFITPEYAYGVPGSLKNALDWIVSGGELVNKPTALITAATGGEHAHSSLLLTLQALSAKPADGCDLLIPFVRSKIDENGKIKDEKLSVEIEKVVVLFSLAVLEGMRD